MQNSVNRLSQIFVRPVRGIHNPTSGLVFDLIKCLIQRNFCYATQDVRDSYDLVKQTLWDDDCHRLILIAHSQGGIATSLIVDWLVGEISQGHLQKLEIYTFGNAANHFNNPRRLFPGEDGHIGVPRPKDRGPAAGQFRLSINLPALPQGAQPQAQVRAHPRSFSMHHIEQRTAASPPSPITPLIAGNGVDWRRFPFIEHYANSQDFVCKWGVLHFIHLRNRYLGHLFLRQGTGHLFIQHYLDTMFSLNPVGLAGTHDAFMASIGRNPINLGAAGHSCYHNDPYWHLSRLWRYRDGGLPLDN
ncbi:uncharacterized protein KD926_002360 [Aspergillus affinis]|uniref:uncharacterized protein n=1 Tax=Aspergillus affinis TaxID=1070780 RepID=UPI0022FDD5D5|nr:uncharacterized protein KD926_002360 [Aspergillus affinis]KAI9043981.1 hypothetical protein KD926_002360 [Aspergillus affinis]